MQVNQAESFQGLEINFGELLLVYFMRLPQTLKHWVLWGPLERETLWQIAPLSSAQFVA